MRKFILTLAVLGLSFMLAAPVLAADEEEDPDRIVNTEVSRSHNKIKRGAINMVTAPLEIVKQTKITIDEGGDSIPKRLAMVVPGVFKGVGYTFVRFASGAWDLVTFNNFFYEEHEPVLKPEYVWEGAEEK